MKIEVVSEEKKLAQKLLELLQGKMICPFCEIAKGRLAAYKVYEDNDIIAVLDIQPATYGHIRIFPRQHYERLEDVPPEVLKKMIEIAQRLVSKIREKKEIYGKEVKGFAILIRDGMEAEVPHINLHLIPRYLDDDVIIAYRKPERERIYEEVPPNYFEEMMKALKL